MHWDVFCRVIDNFGDIGVCWRLAADLADRGETVRLWVDDGSALDWLAPRGHRGVEIVRWTAPAPDLAPHDVVIEAFGCDPPAAFVRRMAATVRPPVWINLEYLSAEDYVDRSHGLPSPHPTGLTKWFFYPGFTRRTGGLLREPGLLERRAAFDRDAWLRQRGWPRADGERVVTLFCYDNPQLPALLERLAARPTLLLLAQGAAQRQALHLLDAGGRLGALRGVALPWLPQADYDRLLWAGDLNFVRGEDSFVRAQWAGAPFVWHIYPQHDGVHADKLAAFLDRHLDAAPPPLDDRIAAVWQAWNGLADWPDAWPDPARWADHCRHWRDDLLAQGDLTGQLLGFVAQKR